MSAVKRAKLEEGQPAISYEAFVQELDTCDSFTSSMIDILVKVRVFIGFLQPPHSITAPPQEVADRRTRSSAVDRRLISQHTADCLRTQAGTRHIYRQYTGWAARSRRPYIQPAFSTAFSDEEDDIAESAHPPEGVRVNSDLYDAYRPVEMQVELAQGTSHTRDPDRALEMILSPRPRPSSPPPPLMTARRPIVGPTSSSLVRQNSIRRSTRPRTTDFSDFTSRRRTLVRQNREPNGDTVRPEESSDGTWRFLSSPEHPEAEEGQSSAGLRRRPRRFFPLSAWSDPHLRIDPDDRSPRDGTAPSTQPPIFPPSESQSSAELWYSLTAGSPPSASSAAGSSRVNDIGPGAPRLRRGGLQAPEALLSRFAPTPAEELLAGLNARRRSVTTDAESAYTEAEQSRRDEVTQLLTPRSVSPLAEN